jgi:serine/threonine protein kinase
MRNQFTHRRVTCGARRRQVLLRQPYGEKSDIWSLGHLIYELCTQELLFSVNTMASLVERHDQPYKGIDTGYYSEGLASTVAWMLTQDSELRPSAQEVLSSPFMRQLLQEQLDRKMEEQKLAVPLVSNVSPVRPPPCSNPLHTHMHTAPQ